MCPPKFISKEEIRSIASVYGKGCWIYFLLQLAISVLLALIFSSFLFLLPIRPDSVWTENIGMLAAAVTGLLCSFMTIALLSKKVNFHLNAKQFHKNFGLSKLFSSYILVLGTAFILQIAISLINFFLSEAFGVEIISPDFSLRSNLFYNVCLFLQTVIVAPLAEECFFRGFLLQPLAKHSKILAIVSSSLLFSLMHLNFAQGIPAFFVGCLFAYMSLRYESLLLPIGMHALNNFVSFLVINVPSDHPFLTVYGVFSFFSFAYLIFWLIKTRAERKEFFNEDPGLSFFSTLIKTPSLFTFILVTLVFCVLTLFI